MKINFKGYVGKDAALRTVKVGDSQVSVVDFWVAENIRSRDGESEKTAWHKITIWRKYAETMAQYLKKGRRVEIDGVVEAKFYTNSEGKIVPYIQVNGAKIEFLDRLPKDEAPAEPAAPAEAAEPAAEGPAPEEMPW